MQEAGLGSTNLYISYENLNHGGTQTDTEELKTIDFKYTQGNSHQSRQLLIVAT